MRTALVTIVTGLCRISVVERQKFWFAHPHALKSGQSSERSQSTQGPQGLYRCKVRISQGICHQAYQGNLHGAQKDTCSLTIYR